MSAQNGIACLTLENVVRRIHRRERFKIDNRQLKERQFKLKQDLVRAYLDELILYQWLPTWLELESAYVSDIADYVVITHNRRNDVLVPETTEIVVSLPNHHMIDTYVYYAWIKDGYTVIVQSIKNFFDLDKIQHNLHNNRDAWRVVVDHHTERRFRTLPEAIAFAANEEYPPLNYTLPDFKAATNGKAA